MLPIAMQCVQHALPGSAGPATNFYNNPVPYNKLNALDALQVMMYDHRGVVKSGPARMEQQTSALLAGDAVQLLDAVWGRGTPVHVYG
jgi:flavin-dependent dehydrogenase